MNEREILEAICGVDNRGVAKSNVNLMVGIITVTADKQPELNMFDTKFVQNAVVNIEKTISHTKIELTFPDDSDEREDCLDILFRFKNFIKNSILAENQYETITLTIQPELNQEYYLFAENGMYTITTSDPVKLCDSIVFVFDNKYVDLLKLENE